MCVAGCGPQLKGAEGDPSAPRVPQPQGAPFDTRPLRRPCSPAVPIAHPTCTTTPVQLERARREGCAQGAQQPAGRRLCARLPLRLRGHRPGLEQLRRHHPRGVGGTRCHGQWGREHPRFWGTFPFPTSGVVMDSVGPRSCAFCPPWLLPPSVSKPKHMTDAEAAARPLVIEALALPRRTAP